ncbi:hypothetical protein fugu_015460 [Takifugu bimaculatus]|uniref:Uncharacterized protein n=1 Tax=Takifugu bimaculatus TaxID=433685 RepID=A0A4Z2BYW5_9TELE|nr:hypothetical protein fugu_015460 [Takifugu bimaculatus]
MQVQIRGSDTRVTPAGLKPYVSLPSTCMQVLTFPVCSHSLLQWADLSLQDIGLQQEPGTDDGLYGEEAITGEASQVWYRKVKSTCYNRNKNENYGCKPQLRSETLDGDFHVTDEARGFSLFVLRFDGNRKSPVF